MSKGFISRMTETNRMAAPSQPPNQISPIPQDPATSFLRRETFHRPPLPGAPRSSLGAQPFTVNWVTVLKNQTAPSCLHYVPSQTSRCVCPSSLARRGDFLETCAFCMLASLAPYHSPRAEFATIAVMVKMPAQTLLLFKPVFFSDFSMGTPLEK